MSNKLLKKFSIDIFFISIGLLLIVSIIESADIIDIAYFCCVVYYYARFKIYRWKNCQ